MTPSESNSLYVNGEQLAALFTRYRAQLRRMVEFRMDARLLQRVDPSDVLQDAYVNALNRLEHLNNKPEISILAWLRRITEQTLIDLQRFHLNAQQRAARREIAYHNQGGGELTTQSMAALLAGDDSTPSQAAVRDERCRLLEMALKQMDPIDREILALRHFEELDNVEVCEILGLQPTAASNRYIRALQRLKEIVDSVSALRPL